jgi:hypothetical protein
LITLSAKLLAILTTCNLDIAVCCHLRLNFKDLPSVFKATGTLSVNDSAIIYALVETLENIIINTFDCIQAAKSLIQGTSIPVSLFSGYLTYPPALDQQVVQFLLGNLVSLRNGCYAYFTGLRGICPVRPPPNRPIVTQIILFTSVRSDGALCGPRCDRRHNQRHYPGSVRLIRCARFPEQALFLVTM